MTSEDYLHQVTIGTPDPGRLVTISDYDPAWPEVFESLAADISGRLGDVVREIHHVGSTSVPELAAKPIIDIDLVVRDSAAEDDYVPALEQAGYRLRIREPEWHEHRVLKHDSPAVNLHVFGPRAAPYQRDLVFRDWLRAHPQDRRRYEEVKRDLAAREWKYVQDYADAKNDVVAEILAKAGYAP